MDGADMVDDGCSWPEYSLRVPFEINPSAFIESRYKRLYLDT